MSILTEIHDNQHGFIKMEQLDEIIEVNRFTKCLVRCGNGRFIAPAQNIKHFVDIIEKSGDDHVRDISLYIG